MAQAENPGDDSADSVPMTAKEFVAQRIREAEGPLSPSEIAEEWGCTNGHVRHVLNDLREEGEVERVGHGKYAHSSAVEEQQEAEDQPDSVATETNESPGGESAEKADSSDGETGDSSGVRKEEAAAAAAAAGGAGLLSGEWDRERWLVIGVVAAVIVVWWVVRSDGSSEVEQTGDGQDDQDDQMPQDTGGGIID